MAIKKAFGLGMFSRSSGPAFPGVVLEDTVLPISSLLPAACASRQAATLSHLMPDWSEVIAMITAVFEGKASWRASDHADAMALSELSVHMPLSTPSQIICVGANYKKHVIDLVTAQGAGADTEGMSVEERRVHVTRRVEARAASGTPYAFPKLMSSLAGPAQAITLPDDAEQFDWELELGLVIAKPAWRVKRSEAMQYVAGYMIVNDLTRRELVYRSDLKSLGSDWLRAKSGPEFMPTGPFLVPEKFVENPHDLRIQLKVNDVVMQDESTADMIFDIPRLIEYLTSYVRLLPGDIIATGSPAGNGAHHGRFLRPGDIMEGTIDGLGRQRNTIVSEGI